MHLEEWEKAWKYLQIAHDMGVHLPVAFHKDYPGGIDEFKEKTGIEIRHPFYRPTGVLGERIFDP